MKYIKTYENIEYNNTITVLSNHLLNFMKEITGLRFLHSNNDVKHTFWFEAIMSRKALFNIYKIDYYVDDPEMLFEFKLDTSILKNDQINYVPDDLFNVIMFIYNVMKKYESQNMIKFSDINNIINDISRENYQINIDQNKFNL